MHAAIDVSLSFCICVSSRTLPWQVSHVIRLGSTDTWTVWLKHDVVRQAVHAPPGHVLFLGVKSRELLNLRAVGSNGRVARHARRRRRQRRAIAGLRAGVTAGARESLAQMKPVTEGDRLFRGGWRPEVRDGRFLAADDW